MNAINGKERKVTLIVQQERFTESKESCFVRTPAKSFTCRKGTFSNLNWFRERPIRCEFILPEK
jgi:hypothetical protein